jgi:hypothetical protein
MSLHRLGPKKPRHLGKNPEQSQGDTPSDDIQNKLNRSHKHSPHKLPRAQARAVSAGKFYII